MSNPELTSSAYTDLSGVRSGTKITNAHMPSGSEREVLLKLMDVAGKLGKLCEHCVLTRWAGNLEFHTPAVFSEAQLLWRQLLDEYRRHDGHRSLVHTERARPFQEMGAPLDSQEKLGPINPTFRRALRFVDDVYGIPEETSLWRTYEDLPSVGGAVGTQVRYVGEATALLLREIWQPGMIPGSIPDLHLNEVVMLNKKLITQFDAIQLAAGAQMRQGEIDWKALLTNPRKRGQYAQLEIKTNFRAREGDGLSESTIRWYLKQVQNQLANLALYAQENFGHFNFPRSLTLCVLQGFGIPTFREFSLDYQFYNTWFSGLEEKYEMLNADTQVRAIGLMGLLWDQREMWRKRKRVVFNAAKPEQKNVSANKYREIYAARTSASAHTVVFQNGTAEALSASTETLVRRANLERGYMATHAKCPSPAEFIRALGKRGLPELFSVRLDHAQVAHVLSGDGVEVRMNVGDYVRDLARSVGRYFKAHPEADGSGEWRAFMRLMLATARKLSPQEVILIGDKVADELQIHRVILPLRIKRFSDRSK